MSQPSEPRSTRSDLELLAIGDVHLGTRPSRLPESLGDWGVDPQALTPESALRSAVDLALERRVDAVVFAGDVVESTNARFEALRPLEAAVRRLLDARIPVLAVVGNHDVEALPRLASMIEGFELLGAGGRWQARVLHDEAGRPVVEIVGWSFPEHRVHTSPVAELIRNPVVPSRTGVARIGLLHGDLDASGGGYAPFTSGELGQAGLDAWLLGHIHKPSLTSGENSSGVGPRGYLGSLVGLDPGETGSRGPWLVRVSAEAGITAEQRPIAPLRWDRFDLRVGENETPDDIGDRLLEEAAGVARAIQAQGCTPLALGLRPRLVGATRHYDALRGAIASGRWREVSRQVGATLVFIETVVDGLELAHDLAELARGDDPPALLARKLLALAGPGSERAALLEEARTQLQEWARDSRWLVLEDLRDAPDPLSDDSLVELLTRSGTAALSELLSQRDGVAGAGS